MVLALALLTALAVVALAFLSKEGRIPVFTATISLLLVTWLTQTLVTAELLHISPDLTYGSDARFYWEATLKILSGEAKPLDFPAPLYVFWQVLVVQLSPGVNFLWVLFANSVLFAWAFLLQVLAIVERLKKIEPPLRQVDYFVVVFAALSFWANGIVLWMVARGMKEVLIAFFLSFMMYLYSRGTFHKIASLLLTLFAMAGLRPLGIALPLIGVLSESRFFPKIKDIWVFLILILVALSLGERLLNSISLLGWFREQFGKEAAEQFFDERVFSVPILGYWAALVRFVLGPGPFRSFEQLISGTVFEVSTRIGDILIFLGSVHWWITLILLMFQISFSRRARKNFGEALHLQRGWFFMGLTLAATYAYIYFGTGDTRHRALLYLLWSPVFVTYVYIARSEGVQPNAEAPTLPHHPR